MELEVKLKHVDAGLINNGNAAHIIAAVQALLHSLPMVKFLLEDTKHRKSCRSLLQCTMCALHKIYDDMSSKGFGDPTPLVMKWRGTSSRMTLELQNSALQALLVLIDIVQVQHLSREPKSYIDDMASHPLTAMWKSVATVDVSCPACGQYNSRKPLSLVTLTEIVTDLKSSIFNALFTPKKETCSRCTRELASTLNVDVMLAQCLIVHVERCSSKFSLPFEMELQGCKLSLRSVIAQKVGSPCVFFAMCPDGTYRKFEDSKVSKISAGALCTSQLILQSKLTLIFEGEQKITLPEKVKVPRNAYKTRLRSDKVQVVHFPDISSLVLSPIDTSSLEVTSDGEDSHQNTSMGKCDACTQTDDTTVTSKDAAVTCKDAAVQTEEGPIFTYDTCKNKPKFKFFTGCSVEDFNALFNLIGGEEVIRTLKLEYRQPTPIKLRATKLTSKDKLFLFLLRLRRGLPLEELSVIFNLSEGMISKIVYAMMRLIYLTFKSMEAEMFVSAVHQKKDMPKKMRPFTNLRVLLDGVSFFIETPSNFEQQGNTFSRYKSHNVLLFSVGISCNGATIFCSDGMEGCMSDKEVILKSGLLERLSKGDGVMTDRGYELTAELQAIGCNFYKPPNVGERRDLTPEEEILTKAIASARIYTEHAMADIKDNRLLRGTIPLTMLPILGDLVYIAAYLRNFNPRRIHDKKIVVAESECNDTSLDNSDISFMNRSDTTLMNESEIT